MYHGIKDNYSFKALGKGYQACQQQDGQAKKCGTKADYDGKCPLSSIKLNYDFHSRFGDIWGQRGWTRAPIFLAGKKITKTRLDMWGSTQKIVTIFMGRLPLEQYHSRFLQRVFSMDWTILIFFLGCSRFITLQVEKLDICSCCCCALKCFRVFKKSSLSILSKLYCRHSAWVLLPHSEVKKTI